MSVNMNLGSIDHSYKYGPEITKDDIKTMKKQLDLRITTVRDALIKTHGSVLIDTFFDGTKMHMSSVAIVGTYLRRKNKMDHLYVCSSLQALQEKLREFSTMAGEIRAAFVLPFKHQKLTKSLSSIYHWGDPYHKIAVCIEKVGADVRIVVLDSLGTSANDMGKDPKFFNDLSAIPYIKDESSLSYAQVLFRYIYQSFPQDKKPQVFCAPVVRQEGGSGCMAFSLRDAVSFLRDPRFFEKIECKKINVVAEQSLIGIYQIMNLPHDFMKGVQDVDLLDDLEDDFCPDEMFALNQSIKKHTVTVVDPGTKSVIEDQNHYINQRAHKYRLIILKMLEEHSMEEVQAYIAESLLLASKLEVVTNGIPSKSVCVFVK